MANIVGEGFSPEIRGQVTQRQSQYGSINRDNITLNYLNNNTGWVKLISSVDLTPTVAKNRGVDLSGAELSKAYVLSGGVSPLKAGIARNGSITNSNVYGLGGNEFGLRPMPGITKASIKTETNGALKTATVNLKANNRTQFDIIDLLYMRLGYSVLLEWGHTSYFTNDGTYISDNLASLETEFLNGSIKYEDINGKISDKRNDANGNYDAVFAKVVNFSWSFQPDGTYDITLTLRSMGDVISSLKSNILLEDTIPISSKKDDEDEEEEDPIDPETEASKALIHYRNSHSIGRFFYDSFFKTSFNDRKDGDGKIKYFTTPNIKDPNTTSVNFIRQHFKGDVAVQYYVRFGHFLEWMEKHLVPNVNNSPLINIDTDVKTNIVHLQRYQLSTNPGICTFKSKWTVKGGDVYNFIPGGEDFTVSKNGNRYGRIMNSYFSISHILNILENLPNTPEDSGRVGMYDLIDELCKGWNDSTGNFNSLSPNVDAETNTLRIIDSTALPDRDVFLKEFNISTETALFEIYGYADRDDVSSASFINKFDFTTTISNDLATMVTVGATSNGSMVGEDATALSRMNEGLTDRIKPTITYTPTAQELARQKSAKEEAAKEQKESKSLLEENYKESLQDLTEFIKTLGVEEGASKRGRARWDEDVIKSYSNALVDLIKYDQETLTERAKEKNPESKPSSPNSGFLPFDLSLGMKGLSGMKVYQKFLIDIDYLPSNYPTSLEFLIKTITHEISSNQWTTTLESMAIPKNPFGSGAQRELPERKPSGGSNQNKNNGGGNPSSWNDKTITSGLALNPKGHDGSREYPKTQLLFHYSAGWQKNDNGQSVIDTLNKRGLSYHYIITATGHIEQVVGDTVRAFHAGSKNSKLSANSKSIGINLQNIGYARKTSSTEEGITQNLKKNNQYTGNVKLVDYEGKPAPYKGHTFAQEITDAQLTSLKTLVAQLKSNNSGIPSYKWEGKKTFDQLFPPDGKTSYTTDKPGLYTHNSNILGKADILPTPKIIKFFKELVL